MPARYSIAVECEGRKEEGSLPGMVWQWGRVGWKDACQVLYSSQVWCGGGSKDACQVQQSSEVFVVGGFKDAGKVLYTIWVFDRGERKDACQVQYKYVYAILQGEWTTVCMVWHLGMSEGGRKDT